MRYAFLNANSNSVIVVDLETSADAICVGSSNRIIALSGNAENRVDEIVNPLKSGKFKKTRIIGKSKVYLSARNHSEIRVIQLAWPHEYIFERTNVLFHSDRVNAVHAFEKLIHSPFSGHVLRTRFSGNGQICIFGEGHVIEIPLGANEEMFISANHLIGFNAAIRYSIRTYGNRLAASAMNFHYKFVGPGILFVQGQSMAVYGGG